MLGCCSIARVLYCSRSSQIHWFILLMKYEVKLYVGGKVFTESVEAVNNQDARQTAMARNPKAKVIGVNPVFN
jgi:hypothetical protein